MVMADLDSPMLEPGTAGGETFDREYYKAHCGDLPYDHWVGFFGKVADEVIRSFRPTRVFDAGCAYGFLVQAFWDRGVEAYGRDISRFANSKVRQDLKPYCAVGSIAGPIEGKYDLVTCIEVLEHMPETEALEAIEFNLEGHGPDSIFIIPSGLRRTHAYQCPTDALLAAPFRRPGICSGHRLRRDLSHSAGASVRTDGNRAERQGLGRLRGARSHALVSRRARAREPDS